MWFKDIFLAKWKLNKTMGQLLSLDIYWLNELIIKNSSWSCEFITLDNFIHTSCMESFLCYITNTTTYNWFSNFPIQILPNKFQIMN